MASVKEISKENIDNQTEDPDDIRGDGKKKKFKPLSAVRKFFGGGKKRKKEDGDVVAVKARSTTALHSSGYDDDDDDDDGGFKSHQKTSKPLVGTRSISEDSIFSPEPREQPPPFTKVAVSEESLPKSTFQSELFSKLNKRRSQYSDDDQDEGIPRSPVPVLTTADVVAEPLKPLTFGKTHSGSTRDSEQSLISVDGSDMEDDLFTAKWKTSVPSRKSLEKPRMSDTSDLESLDFSSIEKTEVLKSTAAKDRISIKPQSRRASRLSRKKKESALSKSLPCLNEELSSPSNRADNFSKTTYNKNAMFDDIDINKLDAKTALPTETASKSSSSANVALSSSAPGKSQDVTRVAVSSSSQNSDASVVTLKGKDGRISPQKDKEKKVAFSEEDHSSTRKSTISDMTSNFVGGGGGSASPSLKVSDPDSDVTMSPREGYKLKRQNRSKTLPTGSTEEENSSKVQRASSHRAPASSSPEDPPPTNSIASSGSVKKLGSTRFSQFESSNASEPSWINKAKQKKLDQSESEEIDAKKQSLESSVRRRSYENILASSSKSSEPVTSQTTKHVPSSTSSSKVTTDANTSNSRTAESDKDKKVEASTSSSSSNSNNKRPSIDISSTKRESIDIDVRELSSIKQRTVSFNTAGKAENAATNKTNASSGQDTAKIKSPTSSSPPKSSGPISMSERAKLFSGANSSSSSSSSSPSSSTSTTAKPPTGVSHLRSGSVKTSPTKSHDSSTSVPFRPGSVKGSPFSSSGISASSSSSNIKSDSSSSLSSSSSTVKRETSDTNNAVTKPSSLASSANAKFSSSPNSKVSASSPSQQTPSSLKTSSPVSSSSSSSSSSISANSSSFSKNNLPAGRAFSSFSSVAKPPITSSASASNVSKSNNNNQQESSSTSPSTPSSSASTTSPSSSNSSKSFPKTQSSPIRSHASFTATSPFRPQVSSSSSNSPSSLSSRTSALSKSTSMKVSSPVQTSVTKTEDKKKETTSPTTTTTTNQPNVPAWRANLQKTDMKIEIIEKKSPSGSSPATNQQSQSKNENSNKFGNNSRVTEMTKKSESSPTIEKAAVSSSNRSSKVLDMVKNFQNLKVST